jgi:thiamine pyrophosphate-dependent acetolactate synthase large subunit-like protein
VTGRRSRYWSNKHSENFNEFGLIHLSGNHARHELDKLSMDVCVYNSRIMGPAHVENVLELACRTAMSRRGVAHVTMPVDLFRCREGHPTV